MTSQIVYVKDRHEVYVSDKYVYHSSVHKMWKMGAQFLDDRYYISNSPLNLKKVPKVLKKKDYSIYRFITLESAPENYLIKQGYKFKQT